MLIVLLACSSEPVPPQDSAASSAGPTWHADVAPIMSASCTSCHTQSGLAGFLPLDDYEMASLMADVIVSQAESGQMPPFMARETDECDNPWGFQHDPRLTDEQLDTLAAWAAAGAPEGDASTAGELPGSPGSTLADYTDELTPISSYTTHQDNGADEFICVSIPMGNDTQQWLTGIEVVADAAEVLHHVLLFIDESGVSESLAGEDGSYECLGGSNVSDATFLGGWVPGAAPTTPPEGSGWPVAAGARLVAQFHYHPVAEPRTDQTAFRIRWADEEPEKTAYVSLIGNDRSQAADGSGLQPGGADTDGVEFRIPAEAAAHQELIRWDVPEGYPELSVWLILNHMHYIGVDMKVWVEHADEQEDSCLLQTPEWDFDWQQSFYYDAAADHAPVLRGGDTLWLRCTYDNTLENPSVVDALTENGLSQPQDVYLGEGSLDEMCMIALGVVVR